MIVNEREIKVSEKEKVREKKKLKNLSLTQLFFSKADSNSSFEASFRSFEPKS